MVRTRNSEYISHQCCNCYEICNLSKRKIRYLNQKIRVITQEEDDKDKEENECSICYSTIKEIENDNKKIDDENKNKYGEIDEKDIRKNYLIKLKKCNHIFCYCCIKNALYLKRRCPCCRRKIRLISKSENTALEYILSQ